MNPDSRDNAPRSVPVFNIPTGVVALVCVLIAVQVLRDLVSSRVDLELINALAFVPGRFAAWLEPTRIAEHLKELLSGDEEQVREAMMARYFLAEGSRPWSIVTYSLLHGGWAHLGVNSLWLLAFGSAVARRWDGARFFALVVATAAAGALAHLVTNFTDFAPVVGASAVASGMMGAAARFAFQPGAPLGESLSVTTEDAAYRRPAPPWTQALLNRRAALFLIVWMVMNFAFGAFAFPLGLSDSPIAWQAHIGGLLAGFFLFSLLDR